MTSLILEIENNLEMLCELMHDSIRDFGGKESLSRVRSCVKVDGTPPSPGVVENRGCQDERQAVVYVASHPVRVFGEWSNSGPADPFVSKRTYDRHPLCILSRDLKIGVCLLAPERGPATSDTCRLASHPLS